MDLNLTPAELAFDAVRSSLSGNIPKDWVKTSPPSTISASILSFCAEASLEGGQTGSSHGEELVVLY